ncbi:MAG: GNAT family N-acetyltransferase [Vogesella sp.]|nr:GNAT family N-acetyltransferase [Vogesella sp.]
MKLSFFPAGASDADTMEQLIHESMAPCYARHGLQWDSAAFRLRAADTRFHWLQLGNTRVGIIGYRLETSAVYLAELHLLPAWQGRGLGAQALAWLRQQAAGHSELRVRTFHDSRALGFYIREGFSVVRQDGVLLGLSCPLPPAP